MPVCGLHLYTMSPLREAQDRSRSSIMYQMMHRYKDGVLSSSAYDADAGKAAFDTEVVIERIAIVGLPGGPSGWQVGNNMAGPVTTALQCADRTHASCCLRGRAHCSASALQSQYSTASQLTLAGVADRRQRLDPVDARAAAAQPWGGRHGAAPPQAQPVGDGRLVPRIHSRRRDSIGVQHVLRCK